MINYLKYQDNQISIQTLENLNNFKFDDNYFHWLSIDSLNDQTLIKSLANTFKINESVINDILDTNQVSKVETYPNYTYLIVENIQKVNTQISIIIFNNLIITIEEVSSNLFLEISTNINNQLNLKSNIIETIIYQILDKTLENYYETLELIGDKIDIAEDKLLTEANNETLNEIYKLKKELINIRRTLWLMRNTLNKLSKDNNTTYLRDILDDIIQLIDLSETYRDIASGMLDIYLSSLSNKTNEIMKVLTVLSTIFIPLTFLAGIYGMNFKYFPELDLKYGYLLFWILSIIIVILMIRFFKKKGWL